MKQLLKKLLFAGAFTFLLASPVVAVAIPQTVAAAVGNCEASLLGIPPWYRGLVEEKNGDCVIVSPDAVGGITPFIWKIVLNGIQIVLVLIAYIALFFILYGGFLFITGGGNSAQIEKGRKSIFNAIIGLIISMGAIAITNMIFGILTGATTSNEFGVPEIEGQALLIAGLNLFYYITGIVAVIVIIIAGLSYAISMGDASKINRAKGMILYAVIGLGVVLIAFALTNFVLARF